MNYVGPIRTKLKSIQLFMFTPITEFNRNSLSDFGDEICGRTQPHTPTLYKEHIIQGAAEKLAIIKTIINSNIIFT